MNEAVAKILEDFRKEQCIPENEVLNKGQMELLLKKFEAIVKKQEGIWLGNSTPAL